VAPGELRAWDTQVNRMVREGTLELQREREDTLIPGRRHERYRQTVGGVPVHGAGIVRQVDAAGMTLSIFGTLHEGVRVSTTPRLTPEDALAAVTRASGVALGPARLPRLAILPHENAYRLVYQARTVTPLDVTLYFIDAQTGEIVVQRSDAHTQSAAVGIGTGVLGDRKKISASSQGGGFAQVDRLRPPVIETYDMRGNLTRTLDFLNGVLTLGASDFATDSDNEWTDGASVDAHTYTGYTYDYFYKRFARLGLDNANIRIQNLTHPVNRQDAQSSPGPILGLFFVNAFYAGDGVMVYGEGLPPHLVTLPRRQSWNFVAGALDVVAHELAHGVTDYSSGLIYENEPGALNEAFSDIMGTAVEFFFQESKADYRVGEDVITPGGLRSLENPGEFGHPDHYSRRYLGPADNGGVHINSGIANQAYYLAIEGGTNRTSGMPVQGVGRANREQMEKVFYRAFAQLMPSDATFATARAATIQAARDLYGPGSAAERAVTDAWTAVGVN
jgi:thermolysin